MVLLLEAIFPMDLVLIPMHLGYSQGCGMDHKHQDQNQAITVSKTKIRIKELWSKVKIRIKQLQIADLHRLKYCQYPRLHNPSRNCVPYHGYAHVTLIPYLPRWTTSFTSQTSPMTSFTSVMFIHPTNPPLSLAPIVPILTPCLASFSPWSPSWSFYHHHPPLLVPFRSSPPFFLLFLPPSQYPPMAPLYYPIPPNPSSQLSPSSPSAPLHTPPFISIHSSLAHSCSRRTKSVRQGLLITKSPQKTFKASFVLFSGRKKIIRQGI